MLYLKLAQNQAEFNRTTATKVLDLISLLCILKKFLVCVEYIC